VWTELLASSRNSKGDILGCGDLIAESSSHGGNFGLILVIVFHLELSKRLLLQLVLNHGLLIPEILRHLMIVQHPWVHKVLTHALHSSCYMDVSLCVHGWWWEWGRGESMSAESRHHM